jgi:hypothetical protein
MCNCKLCKVCSKPISIQQDCPEHRIKDLVTSSNFANDGICKKCENHIVAVWFERHGISINV